MYPNHGLNCGNQQLLRFVPVQRTIFHQIVLQGNSCHEIHDNIGRVVVRKHFADLDDLGDILQLLHFGGFLPEYRRAIHHQQLGFPVTGPDDVGTPGGIPGSVAAGIQLLDGNLLLFRQIPCDIGDAKAALSKGHAQQISAVKDGIGCQCIAFGLE